MVGGGYEKFPLKTRLLREEQQSFFLGEACYCGSMRYSKRMHNCEPIPFSVAQAYGAHLAPQVEAPVHAQPMQTLVAATVPGKVAFDGIEVSNLQPLQMYSRCADRIEAATRVATGQQLNTQA
jgi:hypothetical protein